MLFHRPCAIDKISEIKNFSWSWAVRICLCITTDYLFGTVSRCSK